MQEVAEDPPLVIDLMVDTNNFFGYRRRSGFRGCCLIAQGIRMRKDARLEVLHRIRIEERCWNDLPREGLTTHSPEARSLQFGRKSRIGYLRCRRDINDLVGR